MPFSRKVGVPGKLYSCAALWVPRLRERVTPDPVERPILLRVADSLEDGEDLRVEGVAWLLDQLGAADLEG